MRIRELLQWDYENGFVECLNALSETAFENGKFGFQVMAFERDRRGIKTFVAVRKNRVVGTYSVFVEPKFIHGGSYVGHVEDVCVRPDAQGTGVGKKLMEHAVRHCKAAGCYKIILHCSPEVAKFYEGLGFYRNGLGMRLDIEKGDKD